MTEKVARLGFLILALGAGDSGAGAYRASYRQGDSDSGQKKSLSYSGNS